MRKRVLALILVLMLAVSLLPLSASADGVDFVSINGVTFSYFGQTVKCGSGTATLEGSESSPRIVLKNAQISKFQNMGTYEGLTTYVAIAYSGTAELEINLVGSNSITAPSHNANSAYVGIYTNQKTDISGGAYITNKNVNKLKISGVDIGIEAINDYGEGCSVSCNTSGVDISALQACCYTGGLSCMYSDMNLACYGNTAVISDGYFALLNDCNVIINMSPVLKNFGGTACGIAASGPVNLMTDCKLAVNMNVDARGEEEFEILGISADNVYTSGADLTLNLSVKSDKDGYTVGIYADKDINNNGNSKIKSNISFSGKHGQAIGISADNLEWVNDISSVITGAGTEDAAIAIMSYIGFDRETYESVGVEEFIELTHGSIYASVDNKNTECGAIVHGFDCTDSYGKLKLLYPANSSFALLQDGDDNAYTVVDENGKPASQVVITEKDYPFKDIDNSTHKDRILWAVDKGITTGYTPVEFRPNSPCTRGQIVTFLWRAKGSPMPQTTENPFVDVKETSPYYNAILWAYENGITTGTDETHFKPSNPCTRAQVVTFLWRADGRPTLENPENPFTDVSGEGKGSAFYEAILWAVDKGITTGFTPVEFRPSATCTRGQIVTFIYRDMTL